MATTNRPGAVDQQPWKFRLFVMGNTANSTRAVANLRQICEAHLAGQYQLEVIDLQTRPETARENQVLVVPTLIRESPPPKIKIIGDLSPPEKVLAALGLDSSLL